MTCFFLLFHAETRNFVERNIHFILKQFFMRKISLLWSIIGLLTVSMLLPVSLSAMRVQGDDPTLNWGWGISYDNGWYSTTGSWTSGGYSFDYGKMMLADFSEIQ